MAPARLDFDTLDSLLNQADNFAILCHINPDGDCIGALLALGRALTNRGKKVTLLSYDGVPGFFKFSLKPGDTVLDKKTAGAAIEKQYGATVLVDCATKKRSSETFFPVIDHAGMSIVIDHHNTNGAFAQHNFIDGDASSTCEILFRFFKEKSWEITLDIAECLYMGIMYDTGRFMHTNTTPEVFHICAELVSMGVDPAHVAGHVFKDRAKSHLMLLGRALAEMKFAGDGRVAWAALPRSVFRELGADDSDTEGIVEMLGAYEGCEVHLFFTEGPDGLSRVSSRSAGRVKVNEICKMFGGGGHDFAAGIRTEKPLDEISRLVVEEAVKRVEALG